MAKISKGFGELLKQQRKLQSSSQAKPSVIKIESHQWQQTPPSENFEEQELRIGEIVGLDEDGEINEVNEKTLKIYYDYLVENLQLPCEVRGSLLSL